MTNRFENRFAKLQAKGEGAFLPFVTLCDPDYKTSLEILKSLLKGGEVGKQAFLNLSTSISNAE